jgi:glycolate oxidase iron-sulfur subunit
VALLAGCVQRVYFPNVNAATLRVLSAEGCEVVAPADLACCGALSLHAGREEEAQAFARKAVAAVEQANVDAIIVNSAGCGSSMKEWGRTLKNDPAWAARAQAAAAKVQDISEYLHGILPRAKRHALPIKAAYHDACHLAHAQKIRAQPRAMLSAIPGLSLSEIPDGDQCCGSAGIYNLVEPESAREIGKRKLANVLSVAPEFLISADPGCTLHLSALMRETGEKIRAAHPIEVLDASIRNAKL